MASSAARAARDDRRVACALYHYYYDGVPRLLGVELATWLLYYQQSESDKTLCNRTMEIQNRARPDDLGPSEDVAALRRKQATQGVVR